MKNFIIFTIFLAAALSLLPSRQVLAAPGIQMHRLQVQEKDSNGWYPARSTNGMFSVLLPLPFNDFSLPGDRTSEVSHSEIVGCKSTEGIKFSATRVYYVRKGLAEKYFSKIKSGKAFPGSQPRSIRIKNHDAVDIEVSSTTSGSVQRAVLVNESIILLIVEWPKKYEPLVRDKIATFLSSLDVGG